MLTFQFSDYNFQRMPDGTCQLVPGLKPQDHQENCRKNPDQVEFYYPTGYRKIPISTCQGGRELDKLEVYPCPGHEKEFEEKHGIGGVGLFFAIVIPIAAAIAVGIWVYRNWQAGGFGLGQIRLGDSARASTTAGGGASSLLIAVPVAIISGVVAVVKATPLLATSLWRSAKGYMPVGTSSGGGVGRFGSAGGPYRSRDAFAARRQDYSRVVDDEDELLGDGLDEEGEDV